MKQLRAKLYRCIIIIDNDINITSFVHIDRRINTNRHSTATLESTEPAVLHRFNTISTCCYTIGSIFILLLHSYVSILSSHLRYRYRTYAYDGDIEYAITNERQIIMAIIFPSLPE